ncbi:MAG: MFS transporter [bacterium]|nr:MFS transporter [bacterium]
MSGDVPPASPAPTTAWTPLRHRAFRAVWIAALASNVGTWMQEAAGAWLMTSLAHGNPLLVALMQTAASLPFFLLALPGGALADIVDRRRYLLLTQAWMLLSATVLGLCTLAGLTTPWLLIGLTFSIGVGAALNNPAWAAMIPDLVPRAELPAAVALGSVALNASRAVGPALGGVLVGALGPGWVFLLNAASFLGVLAVLFRWRRSVPASTLPREDVLGALRAGARYVRHSTPLRTVLVRTTGFIVFASAVWALVPIVALHDLELDSVGYGILLGCLGAGAVLAAAVLPALRRRLGTDRLMMAATLVYALASATLAVVRVPLVAGAVLVGAGAAWMAAMSTVNTAAQNAVSSWVRARALATSLFVIQGGMAFGALGWGWVATHAGVQTALLAAAGGLVVGLVVVTRFPLAAAEGLDLTPAEGLPEPEIAGAFDPDDGPVLVTVEYRVDPTRAAAFGSAMRDFSRIRRRDGAELWGLFRDAADPSRFVETFTVDSWAEHLRQHARMTVSDRALREVVRGFHEAPEPPIVTHLLAARLGPRPG